MSASAAMAIDQGTTSTRSLCVGRDGSILRSASRPLDQIYPQSGWVEQDPEQIWRGALDTLREVMSDDVTAIGITNQRETIVLWDRTNGKPIYNAIVWQDRRTASFCSELLADGLEPMVRAKTGLLLDPYFSATKLRWILDTLPGARDRAELGELAAGTIDSFLLWRLTGGRVHATDVTNASRTLLYDIDAERWDQELLALFGIPEDMLPEVYSNTHQFGETDPAVTGRRIPIFGMAGDQQAALIGQRCFKAGATKSTYGTGCFLLANIGAKPILSDKRLLTTPAYRIGSERAFAMEGSIFIAGAVIKWLRDSMGIIATAEETSELAAGVPDDHGIHLVPAFVGMGAPHWRTDVRAAITGMTLDTGKAQIARAALEAVAFQTCDLMAAIAGPGVAPPSTVKIDGGMATNNWFAQFLADTLNVTVERPENHEATALGAAFLAGLGVGLWPDLASLQVLELPVSRFNPRMQESLRRELLDGWQAAIGRMMYVDQHRQQLAMTGRAERTQR